MGQTITVSGPVFDRRADHEAEEFARDALHHAAAQGRSEVMLNLDRSIKHPTPYYETQIGIRDEDPRTKVINDSGVIYGFWLEGIGSRNFPVTRFKGYHSFRRAKQTLEAGLDALLENVLRPFLARMNGEG